MDIHTDIEKELLNDEVIQYIASRHHVTATDVIETIINNHPEVDLEDNEKIIIRDLISMYNHNR